MTLSKSQKRESRRNEARPLSAVDAGLLIATPVAMTFLAGCAYHLLHQAYLVNQRIGPMGLIYSPYLTVLPSIAACAWYGATMGKNGVMAVGAGLVVAVLACMNARGSFYWPGTFGMSHTGLFHTVFPMVLGAALGLVMASFRKPAPHLFRWLFGISCLLALAWTLVDSRRDLGMYSLAPYTWHLALLASYVGALATAVLVRFAEE